MTVEQAEAEQARAAVLRGEAEVRCAVCGRCCPKVQAPHRAVADLTCGARCEQRRHRLIVAGNWPLDAPMRQRRGRQRQPATTDARISPSVLRTVRRYHRLGMNYSAIGRMLTERKVPTPRGGRWSSDAVRRVAEGRR